MSIGELNARFAIAGRVTITAGKGGLPLVEVDTGTARATICTYAGQVLSHRPAGQAEDIFFLSGKAYWADGKAIKGGMPVCWPWFGPDPEGRGRPGHGFVRNRPWDLRGTETLADGRVRVRLGLTDSDETRAIWPHAFDLELAVTIGDALQTALVTRNTGDKAFPLTQGLHTYFRVGDIARVRVEGLEGLSYIDKMDGGATKTQQGAVTLAGETDRVYTGVRGDLAIVDPALSRRIRISAQGSASAVVWNPWADTARAMADLDDDDYKTLLCVETTNAGPDAVTVAPGAEHRLVATYTVGRD